MPTLMNDINSDLVVTVEVPEEFENDRLPTLDSKQWLERGLLRFIYFEKSMNTPYLLMKT